ncbi:MULTISPECIES: UDP-glucose 4-epimerase GalE [unclassified Streptomyces]|uniref:UDP-glucose 4-epimerase GalE n=1 Tax=unclassified Streptomyces TaxID=2593676 RepID=UPI001660B78F|nr:MULTISPECIES: UDP-glucose 4-epimerase GalE [unclassified Streptomyces]MBD0710665.1 UDP-glucose 4-epimerase GalE [Streptomyces sp. CBMA291]MBD0715512.1 UDP-glucose 4-epimerase GalE [Streptomyces sp. CBMA370]
MKVLITGGAGFIGSTIASACLDDGIDVVVLDDLATGRSEFVEGRTWYRGDIADGDLIDRIFTEHPDIDATIGCAAKIVVPESVAQPLYYYTENVSKGLALLGHLIRNGCERFLFSSSAAIYQAGQGITESAPLAPTSPYARTKAHFENALEDVATGTPLRAVSLRYFNPIGCDPKLRSGLQITRPTHALGVMIDAFHAGRPFPVTGTDWETRDGTGIRDYVHVHDLASAHIAAVRRFDTITSNDPEGPAPYRAVNLGSGTGTTVLELIKAFENVTGKPLATETTGRRPGDNAGAYPDITLARELLGWEPALGIEQGISDSLAWYARRPLVLTEGSDA